MVGVYMGVAFIAVLIIAIFMDKLPKELDDQEKSTNLKADIGKLLVATVKHLKHVPQILLIPLTMYSGFEQAYFSAEWSRVRIVIIVKYHLVRQGRLVRFMISA